MTVDAIKEREMEELLRVLPLTLWTLALAIPLFFILGRAGKSRWWILMALFPIVGGTILIWVIAFSRWPVAQVQERAS